MIPPAPQSVLDAHPGWRCSVAWAFRSDAGVYRLDGPAGEVRFLKVRNDPRSFPLTEEASRLCWARPFITVPDVVDCGRDGEVDWLLTSGLPGLDGTDASLLAEPERLIIALTRGLRHFHEALPVASCPFDFRIEAALAHVRRRADAGFIDPDHDFEPEYAHLSVEEAIRELETNRPASKDLVVCHGDYCFPNLLLEDREVTSYIDLGELGVADRWCDLAVATWSEIWNLGPSYEDLFLETYGVKRDDDRIAYYRLLQNLKS